MTLWVEPVAATVGLGVSYLVAVLSKESYDSGGDLAPFGITCAAVIVFAYCAIRLVHFAWETPIPFTS